MKGNSTRETEEHLRPRCSRQLLVSYLTETLWESQAVQTAFEAFFPTLREYGLIHVHVDFALDPILSKLKARCSVADFVVGQSAEAIQLPNSMQGSGNWCDVAMTVNAELIHLLKRLGMIQNSDWPQAVELPTLPVVPWLLHEAAGASEHTIFSLLTSAKLAEALGADTGLPLWMRQKFAPTSCERHLRRFRDAVKMLKKHREDRYYEAGGDESDMVRSHPGLAVMYPKLLKVFGRTLLEPEKVESVISEYLPFVVMQRYLPRPKGTKIVLAPDGPTLSPGILAAQLACMDPLGTSLGAVSTPSLAGSKFLLQNVKIKAPAGQPHIEL